MIAPRTFWLSPYHYIADVELITMDVTCGRIRVRGPGFETVLHALEFRIQGDLRFPGSRVDLLGLPESVISIARASPGLSELRPGTKQGRLKAATDVAPCPGHPEVL